MLNHYSLKRIDKLNAEVPARIALAKRCGGKSVPYDQVVKHNGVSYIIRRVACIGGTCEICKKPAEFDERLEPHEDPKRSTGTTVSLEFSKMCHHKCHPISKPQLKWLK